MSGVREWCSLCSSLHHTRERARDTGPTGLFVDARHAAGAGSLRDNPTSACGIASQLTGGDPGRRMARSSISGEPSVAAPLQEHLRHYSELYDGGEPTQCIGASLVTWLGFTYSLSGSKILGAHRALQEIDRAGTRGEFGCRRCGKLKIVIDLQTIRIWRERLPLAKVKPRPPVPVYYVRTIIHTFALP